jgi:hypothetical protein
VGTFTSPRRTAAASSALNCFSNAAIIMSACVAPTDAVMA